MAKNSTTFLKAIIYLIGLTIASLCGYLLYAGLFAAGVPMMYRSLMLGMLIPAVPFFFALYQGLLLLQYIDARTAFSQCSVDAIRRIRYSAYAISALYTLGMPHIYYVAEKDDAPGVIALGLVFIFAPLVVGVFATVLQRLLQDALDIKSENDLTI